MQQNKFGDEKIILSIDAKRVSDEKWHAFTKGGKNDSKLRCHRMGKTR